MAVGVFRMSKRRLGELLRKRIWYRLKANGPQTIGEIHDALSEPNERIDETLRSMLSTGLVVQRDDDRYAIDTPGKGGKRPGAGRKRSDPSGGRLMDHRRTITMRAADLAWAQEHGGARREVAKGVRYAIAVAREMERRGELPDLDDDPSTTVERKET